MQHLTNQHNYPSMPTRHRSRHLDVLIIFGSVLFFILGEASGVIQGGMLYPQESESRQIQTLDGVWSFRADRSAQRNEGFLNSWWEKALSESGDVIPMPVPSSYNDITTDKSLRDFVGWVWYDREFYVSNDWQDRRIVLRFDSAHYYTIVWVNGHQVMEHNGGHLPFESAINQFLKFGFTDSRNRVTVAINNTLSPHTLPPGSIQYQTDTNKYPPGYFVQNLQMDFFNYAGIHRSVRLYTTPKQFIDDITITTDIQGTDGIVDYEVVTQGTVQSVHVSVMTDQVVVGSSADSKNKIVIPSVRPWWPYSMNKDYGFMYTLLVNITGDDGKIDIYRQRFGVRTIKVIPTQFLINNKPFYCHGIGNHEDSDTRGKGLDIPLIIRDINMMKWLGVNCFRMSVYPYSEEIIRQADEQGIAVIAESPGIGIIKDANFDNKTSLPHHMEVMEEMVRRDKNKPSVIMWSVANEPSSTKTIADYYFKTLISHTRSLDPTRPVTFVTSADFDQDKAVKYVDVICINRYYGWYSDDGHTEIIKRQLEYDLRQWWNHFGRPVIVTEYGAGTVAGLHTMPSYVFTEDYQVELMQQYHEAFDGFRGKFLVGEIIWTFADFSTAQTIMRVVGNRKGVLTRQRQPKASAHLLRDRYQALIHKNHTNKIPCKDLY